jgi:hypothetical protein
MIKMHILPNVITMFIQTRIFIQSQHILYFYMDLMLHVSVKLLSEITSSSEVFRCKIYGIFLMTMMNVLTPIKQIKTRRGNRKQYRIKKPTIQMKLNLQLINS